MMSRRGDTLRQRKCTDRAGHYGKRRPIGTSVCVTPHRKTGGQWQADGSLKRKPKQTYEITFGDIAEQWMAYNRLRLKGGTLNKYRALLDTHLLPSWENVKLSEITSAMLNAFLADKLLNGRQDRPGGLSPSYVNSMRGVLCSVLSMAVREQQMPPLPMNINRVGMPPNELPILSPEEQKRLENFLKTEPDATKLGILLSLHTGLRIGEVCALAWQDVDLRNGILHVRHTIARVRDDQAKGASTRLIVDTPKTRASKRDIPISSWLSPLIAQVQKLSSSPYVVADSESFISPRTYEYRYHRLLEACGIAPIRYHALRHTFATRCIEAGVDVKSLSEILGHASVNMTLNIYVHSSMQQKRLQIEKLSASIA